MAICIERPFECLKYDKEITESQRLSQSPREYDAEKRKSPGYRILFPDSYSDMLIPKGEKMIIFGIPLTDAETENVGVDLSVGIETPEFGNGIFIPRALQS